MRVYLNCPFSCATENEAVAAILFLLIQCLETSHNDIGFRGMQVLLVRSVFKAILPHSIS